jgi:hypothetical protein
MSTTDQRRALARRWLSKARTDLALATVVLEQGPDMDPWVGCFHAQQAAEKAHIHDLGTLAAPATRSVLFAPDVPTLRAPTSSGQPATRHLQGGANRTLRPGGDPSPRGFDGVTCRRSWLGSGGSGDAPRETRCEP